MIEPSHVELIATSRELLFVVIGGDTGAMEGVAARLRAELVAHFDVERRLLAGLPPRAVAATRRGQHMLLEMLDDLLTDLEGRDRAVDSADWLARVTEVQLALRRQAVLESLVLRRQRRRMHARER